MTTERIEIGDYARYVEGEAYRLQQEANSLADQLSTVWDESVNRFANDRAAETTAHIIGRGDFHAGSHIGQAQAALRIAAVMLGRLAGEARWHINALKGADYGKW